MAENDHPDVLESKLGKLRAAYRSRLKDELEQINLQASAAQESNEALELITTLSHRLHKLAGSAGTFGFHQLGQRARRLERRIQSWLDGNGTDDSFDLERFKRGLTELGNLLDADEKASSGVGLESADASDDSHSPLVAVVERDSILADYLAHQLRNFGFRVHSYENPHDFLEDTEVDAHLLLLDHRAGPSEAAALPSNHWQALLDQVSCPVIFMGGHEDFQARLEAVRAGAESYFVKPLNIPRVAARITRSIKQREQRGERILIIDDDAQLLQHLETVLTHSGMIVQTLQDPSRLLDTTSAFQPELVLMDLQMPQVTGDELAAMLRQFDKWNNLPILFLTQEQNQRSRAQALMRGGDDFIDNPVSDEYLIKTCRNRVRRLRDMQEAISLDGLTGLLRHANIKEALDTELQSADRSGNPLSVVMLDIDHFKHVNDTYGHALGDIVISTLGTLMAQHFRGSDRLGRYGGEEFLAVLPNCDAKAAERLINRLREDFSEIRFVDSETSFTCTLSAGIADTNAFPGLMGSQLLEQADRALYVSKESGRNCVSRATQEDSVS